MTLNRRHWLAGAAAGAVAGRLRAQTPSPSASAHETAKRRFEPQPGAWRRFEVTTRVEIAQAQGPARVWLALPSVNTSWQRSLEAAWSGNAARTRVVADGHDGARMLQADFDAGTLRPGVQLTTQVATNSRSTDWHRPAPQAEDASTLRGWLAPSELIATDGIVRETALKVTRGARTDVDKTRALYEWIVNTTYREPKVRGCGVGDIKTMLETGDFGGKCGDINALFVGLARSVGVPARDVYGLRIAPSAFGYRELGGNPVKLQAAQHCRAEVYLQAHGWTAMDPADVGKVMRQESPEWIRDAGHPLVAPVHAALFGGWEGNWMALNTAHDVDLPGSLGPRLGFFMYPQGENAQGRFDPLDPERFRYAISARELPADA